MDGLGQAGGRKMLGVFAAWVFFTFLYLKIALDALFYNDVSVLAALLMGGVLGTVIVFVSGIYSIQLIRYNVRSLAKGYSAGGAVWRTLLPFAVAVAVYVAISRLIVFGFSKNLHRELGRVFDYRHNLNDDFAMFAAVVFAPLALHYLMVIFHGQRVGRE